MNRILRTDHGTFELLTGAAARGRLRPVRFLDADEALRLLQVLASDPVALPDLRAWGQDAGFGPARDGPLLAQLAAALADGRLRMGRDDSLPSGSWSGVPAGPGAPRPAPAPPPIEPPRKPPVPEIITELVVHVKTADGEPVADANVAAVGLADRTTDENGTANFGRVRPGTYDISAEKPGHSPERRGEVGMDEKKRVDVPAGSRTEVELVQHPQCANVAWFDGTTSGERTDYFGFDHKTNMIVSAAEKARIERFAEVRANFPQSAIPKTEPYWDPVPDRGAVVLEGDGFALDGTPWVSVAIGHETEVEINFDFKDHECIPCIANTTFEVTPGDVAEVVTESVTEKKALFRIKGAAAGKADLRVICDGDDIGRFHIWCRPLKVLRVNVVHVVTRRSQEADYDFAGVTEVLQRVYRQALLEVETVDLGIVRLDDDDLTEMEDNTLTPHPDGDDLPPVFDFAATAAMQRIHDMAFSEMESNPPNGEVPSRDDLCLVFYLPTPGTAGVLGTALQVGSRFSFNFFAGTATANNTAAHELGHCLGLHHPAHDPPQGGGAAATQFALHNHATLNRSVPAYDATNTEPASAEEPFDPVEREPFNVMANDPTNLMGYWHDRRHREPLRYHQWIALNRD